MKTLPLPIMPITATPFSIASTLLKLNACKQFRTLLPAQSRTSPHNSYPKISKLAKSPSTHPLQNSISYLQHPSNLSTLLHSQTSHHPTTRVYSLIIISFLDSPSSLIVFEVLQPLLCLPCTNSLEPTLERPPSVCSSS